jgi:hypothetical protein
VRRGRDRWRRQGATLVGNSTKIQHTFHYKEVNERSNKEGANLALRHSFLFSVPTWEAPLSRSSGDGTPVNKRVHSDAVLRVTKVAVWNCTSFLV